MSEDWRSRAACLDQDLELFFPVGTTGPALAHLAKAQQVCAGCMVREACLQWALDCNVDYGVWGGLDENQRRSLRRRSVRSQNTPVSRS